MTSSIVEDADVLMQSQKSNLSSNLLLSKSVCDMLRGDLFVHITNIVNKYYNEPLKPLQMQTVINLVHQKNMFVLAGTGFGKTRIAKVYWHLFPAYRKPVILVLNPLDTLVDNQVGDCLGQIF
ncbi:hypothetical protein KEM48_002543 [Puccinia striiformis f. sp. tritici PST-130]|nr:hypothetical protein KEM48_002543 [Puccinia striiformis f. sp. tritici PST-130]